MIVRSARATFLISVKVGSGSFLGSRRVRTQLTDGERDRPFDLDADWVILLSCNTVRWSRKIGQLFTWYAHHD